MKKRVWELDFLRGFAIIMMVFDHLMYDFAVVRSLFSNYHDVDNQIFESLRVFAVSYWNSDLRFFGHFFFVTLFLVVSGISYTFSKNNLSRGLKLGAVAILISLVTYLLDEFLISGTLIVFGIIHLYAASILIIYLLRMFIKSEIVLLIIALIIIGLGIPFRFYSPDYLLFFEWSELPKIIIGLKGFGADYFSIVPYTGIILLGTVIGKVYYEEKVSLMPSVKITDKNFVSLVGRKSLLVFIVHQPVLYLLIYLVGYLLGYRI